MTLALNCAGHPPTHTHTHHCPWPHVGGRKGGRAKTQAILRNLLKLLSWVLESHCYLFFLGMAFFFFSMRKFSFRKWSRNVFWLIFFHRNHDQLSLSTSADSQQTAGAGVISQWGGFPSSWGRSRVALSASRTRGSGAGSPGILCPFLRKGRLSAAWDLEYYTHILAAQWEQSLLSGLVLYNVFHYHNPQLDKDVWSKKTSSHETSMSGQSRSHTSLCHLPAPATPRKIPTANCHYKPSLSPIHILCDSTTLKNRLKTFCGLATSGSTEQQKCFKDWAECRDVNIVGTGPF